MRHYYEMRSDLRRIPARFDACKTLEEVEQVERQLAALIEERRARRDYEFAKAGVILRNIRARMNAHNEW